jgi:hypothetical protein
LATDASDFLENPGWYSKILIGWASGRGAVQFQNVDDSAAAVTSFDAINSTVFSDTPKIDPFSERASGFRKTSP